MNNIFHLAAKDLRVAGRTRDTLLATAFFAGESVGSKPD